jgi:hypothetical protein
LEVALEEEEMGRGMEPWMEGRQLAGREGSLAERKNLLEQEEGKTEPGLKDKEEEPDLNLKRNVHISQVKSCY